MSVTLKSFPFDSMEVLNSESNQMEPDRLYEAEIFRKYFAKFLSNGVYFGHYKNYGENSMKVTSDGGLNIKVAKGAGLIEGADFENESDQVLTLERPTSGNRTDRIVVKLDKTLAVRESQLCIKKGNGSTPATLQRDNNIYEICIAEVVVKSTTNITASDITDKRLDKNLCGIVTSLISIDGEELYEQFQEYIDTVTKNLVKKDQDSIIEGKLVVKNGVEADLIARQLTDEDLNDIKKEGFYYAAGGNTVQNKPSEVDSFGLLCMRAARSPYMQIIVTVTKLYRRYFNGSTWTTWSENYDELNPQKSVETATKANSCTGNSATATKLATARNIKLQGVVSGNADFDGSGNVIITTTQANIAVLTTILNTPAANSDSTNAPTTISYPSGFNGNNSAIISIMADNMATSSEGYSTVGTTQKSFEAVRGNYGLQAQLRNDDILVDVSKVSLSEGTKKIQVRLVLMKIA